MAGEFTFRTRRQIIMRDARSRNYWQVVDEERTVDASKVAVLICDMWDDHTCRAAAERVAEMAPRMNEVVKVARSKGARVIHAPSDTIGSFYADHPARKRMLEYAPVEMPPLADHYDPPKPVDDTGRPCDSSDRWCAMPGTYPWTRQHEAIEIVDGDVVSDKGDEVYAFMMHEGLEQFVIMGVHTGMCILHRTFGIKRMVRLGVDSLLVRDLTDAMYDPAKAPYVNHDEGTQLIVGYIEKFWCPSIDSGDLSG